MKNNQYTPIPLSKLIAERLPELETGMWHEVTIGNTDVTHSNIVTDENRRKCEDDEYLSFTPALTFTDCLRAIEMLGEKEGKRREDNKYMPYMVQHRLLDKYLSDRDSIGEKTIAYLTELFTKK